MNLASQLPSGAHLLDRHLEQILATIAHLLINSGYGYARLNKLARLAFVEAARDIDVGTASRISNARIAAVTGLTRTEVSQLLRSADRSEFALDEPLNRAARVVNGWLTNSDFCNAKGNPKTLPFSAGRISFSNLVRRYSGDIPARAMLAEMKRLGMVRHKSDDTIRMEKGSRAGSRVTLSAMRAITPWVHFFSAVGKGERVRELTSNAQQLRLHFESMPQILAATREIENRRAVFVESLRQLGGRGKKRTKYQLGVSIALAVAAANPVSSTR